MGVLAVNSAWRLTTINESYGYSPTYPKIIAVPSRISDATLRHIGKFRSKIRIPALSYIHQPNRVTITRSAQPMTGISQARSLQDEKLVESIFFSSDTKLADGFSNLIVDARPATNAMAQTAMGAGTENTDYYKTSKLVFLGIDNIHVVRDSMIRLMDGMFFLTLACLNTEQPISRSSLEKSGWLKHIKNILDGTLLIVRSIHLNNAHILVHCSDGWDRTAQLSSLSQVCLDPFYRTIDGLHALLDKEWIAFGHKFKDRCGHLSRAPKKSENSSAEFQFKNIQNAAKNLFGMRGSSNGLGAFAQDQNLLSSSETITPKNVAPREISPIFPQFLDCLYQIWTQYPTHFEYDERLLYFLFKHVYSCQFSDFLFNNEKERNAYPGGTSIWEHIDSNRDSFTSCLFAPLTNDSDIPFAVGEGTGKFDFESNGVPGSISMDCRILFPATNNLKYWNLVYFQNSVTLVKNDISEVRNTSRETSAATSDLVQGAVGLVFSGKYIPGSPLFQINRSLPVLDTSADQLKVDNFKLSDNVCLDAVGDPIMIEDVKQPSFQKAESSEVLDFDIFTHSNSTAARPSDIYKNPWG